MKYNYIIKNKKNNLLIERSVVLLIYETFHQLQSLAIQDPLKFNALTREEFNALTQEDFKTQLKKRRNSHGSSDVDHIYSQPYRTLRL